MVDVQTATQVFLGGVDYSGIPGRELYRVICRPDESVAAMLAAQERAE